jgi:hypothetical protein
MWTGFGGAADADQIKKSVRHLIAPDERYPRAATAYRAGDRLRLDPQISVINRATVFI